MGLHIHTSQNHDEALLKIAGELSSSSIRQLQAAVKHFQSRGCKIIRVEHDYTSSPATTWTFEIEDAYELFAIRQD